VQYPAGNYRVEHCRLPVNGDAEVLGCYPFWNSTMALGDFQLLAQTHLRGYWTSEGGTLDFKKGLRRIPELVRIVGPRGEEVFQWSVMDELDELNKRGELNRSS
jgi:hypothetical protein